MRHVKRITQIHLFTTSDVGGGRSAALARLLASLATYRAARPEQPLTLHLLLQRADPAALADLPAWIDAHGIDGRVSLSRARNLLLGRADAAAFGPDSLVAFPDDDAWYPDGLLDGVAALFDAPETGFFFCRYALAPAQWWPGAARAARLGEVITTASSNTIFVRGTVAKMVGGFDEDLGVGARLNGGEDTDFALRAHALAGQTLIDPRPLVGHRDPDPRLRGRYYAGSLKAIARHAFAHPAALGPLARKLAVGGYYVLNGRLTPLGYLRALAARG